ncbi:MAG: hypothetical protein ACE5DX_03220 [Candidatus Dojkabacteria bacterium]
MRKTSSPSKSNPPSPEELQSALDQVSDSFQQDSTRTYLLDDLWTLHDVSKGLVQLFSLPQFLLKFAIGKNMIEVVFNPRSPVYRIINWQKSPNMGLYHASILKTEFSDLLKERWMQATLGRLKRYPHFQEAWEYVDKNSPIDYTAPTARTITISSDDTETEVIFKREKLQGHPRFYIIEFTPTGG